MANILYRGSAIPSTVNSAGGKNAALTNIEIDQNFYALDRDKFDRILGGTITGNATFDTSSTVTINGNLIVNGTTTTINSTVLSVDDINVTLGDVTSPSNATANGGGITLRGATDKTFNWFSSTAAWTSSEHLSLAAGKVLYLNGSSSGTATITAPAAAGSPTLTLPTGSGTFALLGDIGNATITVNTGSGLTGSGSFTTNQFGAATITLSHADTSSQASSSNTGNTFIQSITLDDYGHITGLSTGSVTIGNGTFYVYAGSAMSGGGLLGTANQGGNSSVTISHADTSSQGSIANGSGTVIQGIYLDDYGHITSMYSLDGDSRWVNTAGDTMTGLLTTRSTSGAMGVNTQGVDGIQVISDGVSTSASYITFHRPGAYAVRFGLDNDNVLKVGGWSMGNAAYRIWHSGYMGSGSGLDADTVDGLHIHTGRNNEANKIVRTDATGYIQVGYINSSSGDEKNASNPSYVWGTNGSDSYMRTYSTGSLSVNYANSAGSAPANGGTSTYSSYLNPISGASSYKLAYTADSQRTNAGEWGRVVMYYPPNGQTYGVRVDRADYADSAGSCSGNSASSSTVTINYDNDSNSTYQMLWGSGTSVYGTGGIYCNPYTDTLYAGTIQATSDIRVKTDIKTIDNALDKTLRMRGVSYTRTDSHQDQIGVIAQEIQQIIPQVVSEGNDGMLTVAYGNIVGVLIEAIKELNAKVEDLQNQLANK